MCATCCLRPCYGTFSCLYGRPWKPELWIDSFFIVISSSPCFLLSPSRDQRSCSLCVHHVGARHDGIRMRSKSSVVELRSLICIYLFTWFAERFCETVIEKYFLSKYFSIVFSIILQKRFSVNRAICLWHAVGIYPWLFVYCCQIRTLHIFCCFFCHPPNFISVWIKCLQECSMSGLNPWYMIWRVFWYVSVPVA